MKTNNPKLIHGIHGITSKEGLLWINGKLIPLPEADIIARKYGFVYAEQFVKYLEPKKITNE